jgi:NADPH-dependent ferric siderophore reductase
VENYCQRPIHKYWEGKWEKEKSEKSTMKFLDIKKKPIGNPHQILNLAPKTTQEVRKAEVKAKLITRTYTLQSDKAMSKNFIVDFSDFSFSHFPSQYLCIGL